MFTGLIETTGRIVELHRTASECHLRIESDLAQAGDLQLGESIAVNGVCLTLIDWDAAAFSADVSPETLEVSTLGRLARGTQVNLERALRLCDRLGGHLVSGHVDAVAHLRARSAVGNAQLLRFELPAAITRYLAPKGSIAIDGISLTVNRVESDSFSVMVIPHSLAKTTLKGMQPGTQVNLESDILARYVERLAGGRKERENTGEGISLEFLAKNGFL